MTLQLDWFKAGAKFFEQRVFQEFSRTADAKTGDRERVFAEDLHPGKSIEEIEGIRQEGRTFPTSDHLEDEPFTTRADIRKNLEGINVMKKRNGVEQICNTKNTNKIRLLDTFDSAANVSGKYAATWRAAHKKGSKGEKYLSTWEKSEEGITVMTHLQAGLGHHHINTWKTVIEMTRATDGPVNEAADKGWSQACQGPEESLQGWADRVDELWNECFAGVGSGQGAGLAKFNRFKRGLNVKYNRLLLLTHTKYDTYNKATWTMTTMAQRISEMEEGMGNSALVMDVTTGKSNKSFSSSSKSSSSSGSGKFTPAQTEAYNARRDKKIQKL